MCLTHSDQVLDSAEFNSATDRMTELDEHGAGETNMVGNSAKLFVIALSIGLSNVNSVRCESPGMLPEIDQSSSPQPTSDFNKCTEEVVRELSNQPAAHIQYEDYLSSTDLVTRIAFAKAYVDWLRQWTLKSVSEHSVWEYPIPHYFVPYSEQIGLARTWWDRIKKSAGHVSVDEPSSEWLREALLFTDEAMFLVGERTTGRPKFVYLGSDHDNFRAVLSNKIDSSDALLDYLHLRKSVPLPADLPPGVVGLVVQGPNVRKVVPESPAFAAGILPGDVIIAIDDVPVAGLSWNEIVLKIRGAAGTTVSLVIERGSTKHSYKLIRMDCKEIETKDDQAD